MDRPRARATTALIDHLNLVAGCDVDTGARRGAGGGGGGYDCCCVLLCCVICVREVRACAVVETAAAGGRGYLRPRRRDR